MATRRSLPGTLWVDNTEVASVELADTYLRRLRGLLGRDGIDGAIIFRPGNSVHTLGMRFAIDVAQCDSEMRVLRTVTMVPHRLGRAVRGTKTVVEAEAGQFERWNLTAGSQLRITDH